MKLHSVKSLGLSAWDSLMIFWVSKGLGHWFYFMYSLSHRVRSVQLLGCFCPWLLTHGIGISKMCRSPLHPGYTFIYSHLCQFSETIKLLHCIEPQLLSMTLNDRCFIANETASSPVASSSPSQCQASVDLHHCLMPSKQVSHRWCFYNSKFIFLRKYRLKILSITVSLC